MLHIGTRARAASSSLPMDTDGRPSFPGLAPPEAVDDGVTGIVVRASSPERVAEAIIEVVGTQTTLERMSRRAAEIVRTGRLSGQRVAQMHVEAYSNILTTITGAI